MLLKGTASFRHNRTKKAEVQISASALNTISFLEKIKVKTFGFLYFY